MKATTTICLVVLLICGFFGITAAQKIPGGIVYSDGKDAVYYDYKTGQTTNLTADLKGPAIKGPVAVSEDGLLLVLLKEGKFVMRRFPDGKLYPATISKIANKAVVQVPISPIQQEISNLTLSPDGSHLAFESIKKGNYWVQVEPAKSRPSRPNGFDHYPKYSEEAGAECNAITIFYIAPDSASQYSQYGNTAFYPPTFPIRIKGKTVDYRPGIVGVIESVEASRTTPDIRPGLTLTLKDAQARFSIRRDAHWLAWQKAPTWQSQQLIAIIYKTASGWGPIEIRDIGRLALAVNNPKPGVYEIPVLLNDCQGLAWKPDGSLTYLSEGKVFSIDANRIMEGIAESGIGTDKKSPNPLNRIPVKNILDIESILITSNINGDRLHWVTNDTLLFREKENGTTVLFSWHEEKIEKLLSPAPEEFSYCDQPPLGITGPVSNEGRAIESQYGGKRAVFNIGAIKLKWSNTDAYGKFVGIWVAELDGQPTLEYAFTAETNLEDIKNPQNYTYKKCGWKNVVGNKDNPRAKVILNQVLLLKLNDSYAAIKPLKLELKYKSVVEMPEAMRRQWTNWKGPPPFYEWMTYEWRYWPASPGGLAKTDSLTQE